MAMLVLECPVCHQRLELDAGFAGGVCRCSHCGTLMTVPRSAHRSKRLAESGSAQRGGGASRPVARPISPLDATASARPAAPPSVGQYETEAASQPDEAPKPESRPEADIDSDPGVDVGADSDPNIDADIDSEREPDLGPTPVTGLGHDGGDAEGDAVELLRKPTPPGRLQHYLRALHRHYDARTPQDLSPENMPIHAKYLEQRHRRIIDRLLCMIQPKGSRRARAEAHARQVTAWRDYFTSACQNHEQIAAELKECSQYWAWVIKNQRLPSRLSTRLARYNKRSIAHPWQTLSASVLECLGQLDAQISAESVRTRGGDL